MARDEAFSSLESMIADMMRLWLEKGIKPMSCEQRLKLYNDFNDKYLTEHYVDYTKFLSQKSMKYYNNYLTEFKKYLGI